VLAVDMVIGAMKLVIEPGNIRITPIAVVFAK
jgi:hypothetical protein